MRLGRLIWSHIVDTGDVSVGPSGKWNRLTFDELVSLPEEKAEGSGVPIKDIEARLNDKPSEQHDKKIDKNSSKPRKLPKIRPRLFVREETVWKALTGHGVDFKRIPPLEWKLIICIGSTKEVGISQPDLVRATGQDKRSVPRRTDFLSYKGYIVKRTHMVRGMKTSKLWLTKFAPELPAPTDPLQGMDMSKDMLTRDMEPVPWVHQWVGNKTVKGKEELAYTALVQTIVAVIKAWGTLRLRDLKLKLGVMGLKWQMKIVSKFLRRANERGNLAYTAAQFAGNNVIFKDCIKFMREPTEDDWRVLLATGVRSRPSYNKQTGKKIKRKSKGKGRTKQLAKPKKIARMLQKRSRHPPNPALARWTPEKPFANTLADYVLSGGKEGYTTTEISNALVGPEFYRYLHKYMSNMCRPDNQPPRLSEYQMSSELTKSGSVQAYAFNCTGAATSNPSENVQDESAIDPALARLSTENNDDSASYGFGPVDASAFIQSGPTDLASLVQILPAKKNIKPKRAYNRRKDADTAGDGTSPPPAEPKKGRPRKPRVESAEGDTVDAAPAPSGRPVRKRKASQRVSYVDNLDKLIDGSDTGSDGEPKTKRIATEQARSAEPPDVAEHSNAESVKSVKTVESEENEKTPDRSLPGVYYGIPGSLNSNPHKKGRPRKSVVMIFRSDRFKDPNFLPGWSDYPHPQEEATPPPQQAASYRWAEAPTPANPASEQTNTPNLIPVALPGSDQSVHSATVVEQPATAGREADDASVVVQRTSNNAANQIQEGLPHTVLDPTKASPSTPVEKSPEALSAATSVVEVASAPRKIQRKKQIIKPNEAGMYICEKCNGSWVNDNGLQYHLTKGKNLCNPFYAANPDAMQRSRHIQKGRYASSEPATPGTSASSAANDDSFASEAEPSSAPTRRNKEIKGKAPAKKKDRPVSRLTEPAKPISPAKPRPVLKPRRSILKNRQLAGSGIVPRGVEASEAAAKRIAAEQEAHETAATSDSVANEIVVDTKNGPATQEEYWEPDEDLPYLKQVQPQAAQSSQRKVSEEASQSSDGHKYANQAMEGLQLELQSRESAYPMPLTMDQAMGGSDPYPADLLDSAMRATGNGHAVSASATNQSATARRELPGNRPALSAVARPNTVTENLPGGGSVQRPPPPIQMPTSKFANKKNRTFSLLTERQILPYRIQEIIQYLVSSNGGVFPKDRKTLHWAVLKVFKATFTSSHGILPTQVGTVRGVGVLERDGLIKTGSVAIQPEGHWTQYDIVYLPGVHIKTDPVVSHLKAQAEAVHPEMYIPFPFAPTEDERIYFSSLDRPVKKQDKGPGRRDHKLDGEIATLNAPFYKEKGLAGVRPRFRRARLESESEEESYPQKQSRSGISELSIKRKKKLAGEDDDEDGPPVKRRRGRKRRNLEEEYLILEPSKLSIDGSSTVNPGISSLPASFFSHTAPSELDFLAPNTQLEDDYIPSTPSDFSMPEDEEQDNQEPTAPIGTFADTTELHALDRGIWPNVTNTWFEKTNGSFTMKGWLPTQSERLIEHLPKTSAEMALKITSHCKLEQWADPAYGVFLTSVDGCKAWELSDVGQHFMSGSIAPNYVFMNFSSSKEVSSMAPIDLQWLDENDWTLETIPYEQLQDHDDDPYLQYDISSIRPPKRARGRPPNPNPKPKPKPVVPRPRKYQKRNPRDPTVRELKVQRELNAYPTTKSDYFRSKGEESLGIDWKAEDTRIAAYVAVSTLTGGINKAMDWGLMMRLFPEAKLSNLRKFWSMIKKEREGFIHSLSAKFQDEFLIAYENGEHGSFDFDEPLKYDWLKLVKWTLALVVRESIELPPNRVKFEDELELIQVDKNEFDWRETYHHWQRSVFNRFQDSTSEPASTALDVTPEVIDNYKLIARSWFRALCCTNPEQYSPYEIRDKFKGLVREGHLTEQEVSDLLEATIFDLEHRRVAIKAKSKALTTGRPYRLNEHFSRTLDRYANEVKFSVAADFKLKLDEAFRRGETVELPWRTEDGMILAAFNLQAAGRVRIEPRNRPSIPFGFKPGFYESRKFPKSYYRFDLQIVPTDRYVYNEDIDVLRSATLPENIPAATEDGKLPMWCDFFGTPDRPRWFKMLAGVFFAYATRGAMTDDFATQALKPCFERFEIEVVRKWGLENGLLRELTVPGGAVTVTEWWWLVLGQPMLEMAPAPEVGEGEDATMGGIGGRRTKDQYEEWNSGRSRRRGKYRML